MTFEATQPIDSGHSCRFKIGLNYGVLSSKYTAKRNSLLKASNSPQSSTGKSLETGLRAEHLQMEFTNASAFEKFAQKSSLLYIFMLKSSCDSATGRVFRKKKGSDTSLSKRSSEKHFVKSSLSKRDGIRATTFCTICWVCKYSRF